MKSFKVDFNGIGKNGDGSVTVIARGGTVVVSNGDMVVLEDPEGNWCFGNIKDFHVVMNVMPDLQTWHEAKDEG